MKSKQPLHYMGAQSGSDLSLVVEPDHDRLHQAILALKQPMLLVALPEDLSLSLLRQGLRADINDDSLERLGHLAQVCREQGLNANLYWQPLATLNLPASYANIVLAPRAWRALADQREASLVHNQLLAHLQAEGQLRILLNNAHSLASIAA